MGFALAVVLIILDKIQEKRGSGFRFPVLAVAVGIYLPLGLSVPIFIGGLLAHWIRERSVLLDDQGRQARENTGLLVASGLITGEALMGVAVAMVAAFVMTLSVMSSFAPAAILGSAAMLLFIVYLYRTTMVVR
jgi:uncharacterized oligopeptide transporter (OPT) family protein